MRDNMSFTVFPVEEEKCRLRLEEAIISTINHSEGIGPSNHWLGNYSPELKIQNSGLWLKRGLDALPLTSDEVSLIRSYISNDKTDKRVTKVESSIMTITSKTVHEISKQKQFSMSTKQGCNEIRSFILGEFEQCRLQGNHVCILISGDIHRKMGLQNKMPSVCSVMYQLMHPKDQIIHTIPSGKSSTIKIKYYLD